MEPQELITDEHSFRILREQYSALFQADRRLPGQAFRRDFSNYYAFEYAHIMRREFASFLVDLAKEVREKEVNYMTIEPHAVDYYHRHCGFFGLASFSVDAIVDNYIDVMYRGGNADSFRARGGDVGVFWGESLKWGIFCDRKSWELCLLGSDVTLDKLAKDDLKCMSASNIETYISGLYQNRNNVGREFVTEFERNYRLEKEDAGKGSKSINPTSSAVR
jgi:hypothetical protein